MCGKERGGQEAPLLQDPQQPRVPLGPTRAASRPGGAPAPTRGPSSATHRVSQVSAATAPRAQGCSHAGVTGCLREPPSGAGASLGVERDAAGEAPTRAVRSPRWRVSRLSEGRARPGPGPRGRSSGASSPGLVLAASRGRRCASPLGRAQGCGSARAARRGALPARAGSPAASAPLAGPSYSLSLLLPLARPPAGGLQPPGPPGGGWVFFGVARTCSGPGASPGLHRPPQVAKSRRENAPAPPPPAPSPGCGGRGSRRVAAAEAAAAGGGGSGAAPGASAPTNSPSG